MAGLVVILLSSLVLIGWALEIETLKSVFPDMVAMNPGGTAVGFLLGGASLLLSRESATRRNRLIGQALAAGVVLLAVIRIAGYQFGWDEGPDRWLFRQGLEAYEPPNRMAPNTAACFLFCGLGLLLLDIEFRRTFRPAEMFGLASALIALLAVIGYAYSAVSLIGIESFIPMALNTAVAFAFLSVGILCARPTAGLMAILSGTGAGGVMARRMLPAVVLIPATIGWLRWYAQQQGYFSSVMGLSLFVLTVIVVFSVLIWWNAASLNRTDAERVRAEAELKRNVERTRRIVDTAHEAFIAMDSEGRIVDWNPQAEAEFGWSRGEVLGRPLAETLIPEEMRADHTRGFERFLTTGEGPVLDQRIELPALRRGGGRFTAEVTITAIREGGSYLFTAFLHDITERKWTEAELKASKEEAEAANKAKSEFLANMSHEIRTPMNGIIGMTELALDTELTSEQREYLEMVKTSADYLLAVINDILDFSKIEAGRLEIEAVDFALREHLDETMAALAQRAHAKGLEIVDDVADDIPDAIVGDPVRLRQIIVNLVGNAIKFTDEGEVVLSVEKESGADSQVQLHFSVSDTGVGIPEDKLDRLFKAFSQVDSSTTRKYGGTGLGLAISSQLVQMMNGQIWVESQPGQGSTFHFTGQFGVSHHPPPKRPVVKNGKLRGVRVLVVDDNATNRRVLVGMLTHWEMTPQAVASGREALKTLEQAKDKNEPFHLVLLDNMMPEMDGFELAEEIKRRPDLTTATLMMISSADRREDAQLCKKLGVSGYMCKPVRRVELMDGILQALSLTDQKAERRRPETRPEWEKSDRPLRVLLTEDNLINQKLAIRLLEKRGHSVVVADNGRLALDALQEEAFDVVLMDVQMPELDGFEATALIRKREQQSGGHVPVIAMTAHAMKGDRERCLEAGMDDYVSKPLQPAELFDRIERVAEKFPQETTFETSRARPEEPAKTSEPVSRLEASAIFDKAKALDHVGGDEELLAEIINEFCGQYPKMLDQLREAIATGDTPSLRRIAHTLKGNAGTLGAAPAYQIAERLEQIGQRGDLTGAKQQCDDLESALEELRTALTGACSP